jgi:sulfite reductase alpha subunit-like flavoprotein
VLAGIFSRTGQLVDPAPATGTGPVATVVWASQTGTVEEYANTCAEQLRAAGVAASLRGAEEVSVAELCVEPRKCRWPS